MTKPSKSAKRRTKQPIERETFLRLDGKRPSAKMVKGKRILDEAGLPKMIQRRLEKQGITAKKQA